MNRFKMICLDIDGTLLNSNHKISEEVKNTIKKAVNQNQTQVILVSARMPKGIVFLQKELEIKQPIICYSGALILDEDGNILLKKFINILSLEEIYRFTSELKIHMSLYKDNQWYVEEMDEWVKQESYITNIIPTIMKFGDLIELWKKGNTGPNKILCMARPNEINILKENIKGDNLNIYPSKATYLEIMPSEASKTSAINCLQKKFHIEKSDIIAIGDNYNDIDMIKYAGVGIAMGNAPDDVKKYADDITSTNDEDGVAKAIKKYILTRPNDAQ